MTITLESSIIHILNTAEEYPILSNRPFPLDSEVKDYLTKTIEKTISSDDVKNCFFEKVKNTKIISKRNSHILKGIIYATVSVMAGLYLVLVPTNGSKFLHAIYCFMQNAEISFMAFLIFYFLLSLKEMSVLVGAIHNDKGAKTDKEIKELKEKIQSKQNQ